MKRIIFSYGIIVGLVVIISVTLSIEYGQSSQSLGYLVMFIAFSTIYIATRQYRDQHLGGVIDFKQGLFVGLGITAVAGVIYTAVWEVYLAFTDFKFIDEYAAAIIDKTVKSGASEAEVAEVSKGVEAFRQQYQNPLIRLPQSMSEILPPGIFVSLLSAVALKNRKNIK